MARMLTQVPLPLLPGDAAEIAPGVGMVTGPDGSGVMWVHGLATFAWDAGDEAGRRLAAVQLQKLKAATQAQVAEAFGVIPVSVWRWERTRRPAGSRACPGPQGPAAGLEATPAVVARIRELDGQGLGKAGIAAAAGVSESSVRNVLRPAGGDRPGQGAAAGPAADPAAAGEETAGGRQEALPVLPDPVARDGERALARFGLLGEGAAPVFTPGARYPLAGLLLALPALAGTGLLECARATDGRVRNGFYGLEVMLVVLVFLALLREPRAEGATRVPPAALGRVLGLDRAPEVKTIRRKLANRDLHPPLLHYPPPFFPPPPSPPLPSPPPPPGLAGAGKAAELIMALARHHAAARPAALGFLYVDGHARACFGTRDVQKMHVARLKFPGPATEETWVTDVAGDRCSWSSPSRRSPWPGSCAACSRSCARSRGKDGG